MFGQNRVNAITNNLGLNLVAGIDFQNLKYEGLPIERYNPFKSLPPNPKWIKTKLGAMLQKDGYGMLAHRLFEEGYSLHEPVKHLGVKGKRYFGIDNRLFCVEKGVIHERNRRAGE